MDLTPFAAEVGDHDFVVPVGGRSSWMVGGLPDPSAREVRAPSGVVSHQPDEMIVRVGAGTTVAELDRVLAENGQMAVLDPVNAEVATVGGVLAVGHNGYRALRYGPLRDVVLEVRYVSDAGRMIKAGAPVVKNVSGFDLCRLMVGSLGTLGIIAEVVLRCRPRPEATGWYRAPLAAAEARVRLFRPSAIVGDGADGSWVLLEGHPGDIADEATSLGSECTEGAGPRPEAIAAALAARRRPDPERADLHRRIKDAFDPRGRLNPGRSVLG